MDAIGRLIVNSPRQRTHGGRMAKIIPVDTFDCVVFGATGDLTLRKLLPALYYRFRDGQVPKDSRIIGAARSDLDDDAFRSRAAEALKQHVARDDLDPQVVRAFLDLIRYVRIDVLDENADWSTVKATLDPSRVRVFYLATAPDLYGPICRHLGTAELVTEQSRVVLEKPIGRDL